MKYCSKGGLKISELTLGTVQLGLDYSLNSQRPNTEESFDILKSASDFGINVLDTAREYGDSEETIGTFLKNYTNALSIVSKFKVTSEHLSNFSIAFEEVYESVEKSKRALGIEKIPILLFHKGPEHDISDTCKVIPKIISRLKNLGAIEMGGVSVFEPKEMVPLMKFEDLEAFQVPVNIFDHRLLQPEVLSTLRVKNKIVFARSVFLKGLFFKPPEELAGKFDEAIPYLNTLHKISENSGISIVKLAFSFVRSMPEVTSLIFGADNMDQVQQNIRLLKSPELSDELMMDIQRAFSDVPKKIITPHLWNF